MPTFHILLHQITRRRQRCSHAQTATAAIAVPALLLSLAALADAHWHLPARGRIAILATSLTAGILTAAALLNLRRRPPERLASPHHAAVKRLESHLLILDSSLRIAAGLIPANDESRTSLGGALCGRVLARADARVSGVRARDVLPLPRALLGSIALLVALAAAWLGMFFTQPAPTSAALGRMTTPWRTAPPGVAEPAAATADTGGAAKPGSTDAQPAATPEDVLRHAAMQMRGLAQQAESLARQASIQAATTAGTATADALLQQQAAFNADRRALAARLADLASQATSATPAAEMAAAAAGQLQHLALSQAHATASSGAAAQAASQDAAALSAMSMSLLRALAGAGRGQGNAASGRTATGPASHAAPDAPGRAAVAARGIGTDTQTAADRPEPGGEAMAEHIPPAYRELAKQYFERLARDSR